MPVRVVFFKARWRQRLSMLFRYPDKNKRQHRPHHRHGRTGDRPENTGKGRQFMGPRQTPQADQHQKSVQNQNMRKLGQKRHIPLPFYIMSKNDEFLLPKALVSSSRARKRYPFYPLILCLLPCFYMVFIDSRGVNPLSMPQQSACSGAAWRLGGCISSEK